MNRDMSADRALTLAKHFHAACALVDESWWHFGLPNGKTVRVLDDFLCDVSADAAIAEVEGMVSRMDGR